MQRNLARIGLVNFFMLVLTGAVGLMVARQGSSFAGQAAMTFVGAGVIVTLLSWFQMRLEERERLEKLELEELARSAKGTTLFETGDAEIFPAQRAREQFERLIVPAVTVLLFLLQAGGTVGLWLWLDQQIVTRINQPMLLMSLFGMFALVLLLLGKYGSRLAQLDNHRLLRPGAAYVLLGSAASFLVALGIGAVEAGFPKVDFYLARALTVLLGAAAVETLITLVLEVYRPRTKGRRETRVIYESRLVGLLGQPAGIFTTMAQALDYQFGFKVSDTWFYQFIQRAAGWMILGQLAILLLSTCVTFIDAGEQALLERFGRPVAGREVLGPGIHFKLPWPIDEVYRERTLEVRSFLIGIIEEDDPKKREEHKTIVWTTSHAKEEFNMLVGSRDRVISTGTSRDQAPPVNLLTVNIPVQYEIKDLRAWSTQHAQATNLLEKLAMREVVKYLVGVDFFEFMSSAQERAASELRSRIQAASDAANLGVNVLFVGLQGVHPPVKVGKDFNAVVAALQEKEAIIERARAYAVTNVILARAEATNRIRHAEAYSTRTIANTFAQAAQFTNQVKAFRESPEIYTQRAYLQAIARGGAGARKIVVTSTNAQDIVTLNLEDKIRTDLMDITNLEGRNAR
ncbi:MAG: protease modulator HflK [Verrucomicrobiales bacterium]|nr:protease modulator HflK [Verrucomicrobiales bacterium]